MSGARTDRHAATQALQTAKEHLPYDCVAAVRANEGCRSFTYFLTLRSCVLFRRYLCGNQTKRPLPLLCCQLPQGFPTVRVTTAHISRMSKTHARSALARSMQPLKRSIGKSLPRRTSTTRGTLHPPTSGASAAPLSWSCHVSPGVGGGATSRSSRERKSCTVASSLGRSVQSSPTVFARITALPARQSTTALAAGGVGASTTALPFPSFA